LKSYRDLEIFKVSYDLAIKAHRMSLRLPRFEMYEEGSQVRRSSKGITSCIVEGYGRKRYKAELIKFLTYAQASCDETILHLNFIQDTHDLDRPILEELINAYNSLGKKIFAFTNYVEKDWK